MKSDLHGAYIEIIKSKSPTLIDQKGIIIQETLHTFSVINEKNQLKIFPKENSVFKFQTINKQVHQI